MHPQSTATHPENERLRIDRLRQRHPQDTPAQLWRRLADLLLGPGLAARAYGQLEDES